MKKIDIDTLLGDFDQDFLSLPADNSNAIGGPVPNVFPKIHNVPYKVSIIGEAPGKDEVDQGLPFVGYSGRDLDRYLAKYGILRDACFIGNICQHRPFRNEIARLAWNGPEITAGIAQLRWDLSVFRPNVCFLLGGTALHAFKNPLITPRVSKTKLGMRFVFPDSITDWRGSFFYAHENSPCPGVKCIASFHPAYCLRDYSETPKLIMDTARMAAAATTPHFSIPCRELKTNLTYDETLTELDKLLASSKPYGTDIEGYWNYFRCISFAPSPDYAFIVPLRTMSGGDFWSLDEETQIMLRVAKLLANPCGVKVWQNGLYDRFALQYGHNIVVRGVSEDIMLETWELHCELEKALSVQASLYTQQPFYKSDYKSDSAKTFHKYCCMDSCITFELHQKYQQWLKPASRAHYEFNRVLLNPLLYMELRGLRYDKERAKSRYNEIMDRVYSLQYDLNRITGTYIHNLDKIILRAMLRDKMCWKTDPTKVKKEFVDVFDLDMRILMSDAPLTKSNIGRLETDMSIGLNVDSPLQLKSYLYETLKLPKQINEKNEFTADYEALLKLRRYSDHSSIPIIIEIGELLTRAGLLKMQTDPDGRIRSSYNEVGSETGRITSLTSPTGSGHNLQTIPDENDLKPDGHPLRTGARDLIIADEQCYLAKCDLRGADGWTIGAELASLGERTMLDDLQFGLKPAHFPCYERRHGKGSTAGKSREELREMFKEIKKDDWDYFAAKQCTWGFCVTGDHEVLTPNGWIPIESLQEDTPIASWDKEGYSIQFEVPKAIIKQIYTGPMYSFKGSSFDLLATGDHRMPYRTTTKGVRVTTASLLNIHGSQLPKAGYWIGKWKEPMARLVAAIQSDGNYTERGELRFVFRKQRKIERMKSLLDEFHIQHYIYESFSKRDQTTETTFICKNPPVFPEVAGSWMLEWTWEALKEYMMEYPYWDGTFYGENCKCLFNHDKSHVEWLATFQALTGAGYGWQGQTATGFGGTVYRLTLNNRLYASFDSLDRSVVQYTNLPVYCVTVSTGFFLVRRNNKIMVTGNCYLMGLRKAAQHVLKVSEGTVTVTESDMGLFRDVIFHRYNVPVWHHAMENRLFKQPYPPKLLSPSGHLREFFGRKSEILGQALAHLPQSVTTYATNKAVYRCWTDPDNRTSVEGVIKLRMEPTHQVHDEALFQFRIVDTAWAVDKIKSWFANSITIAGISLTIPFEGAYGTNWSMDKQSKVGTI